MFGRLPRKVSVDTQRYHIWKDIYTILEHHFGYTPLKFNIAPENLPSQKERIVFQLSFFRGYVSLGGVLVKFPLSVDQLLTWFESAGDYPNEPID